MLNTPEMFWVITGALFLSNLSLLIFGFTVVPLVLRVILGPLIDKSLRVSII